MDGGYFSVFLLYSLVLYSGIEAVNRECRCPPLVLSSADEICHQTNFYHINVTRDGVFLVDVLVNNITGDPRRSVQPNGRLIFTDAAKCTAPRPRRLGEYIITGTISDYLLQTDECNHLIKHYSEKNLAKIRDVMSRCPRVPKPFPGKWDPPLDSAENPEWPIPPKEPWARPDGALQPVEKHKEGGDKFVEDVGKSTKASDLAEAEKPVEGVRKPGDDGADSKDEAVDPVEEVGTPRENQSSSVEDAVNPIEDVEKAKDQANHTQVVEQPDEDADADAKDDSEKDEKPVEGATDSPPFSFASLTIP
ncbi:unnamed protein product, partial [Mesorhabditis spiculigera]